MTISENGIIIAVDFDGTIVTHDYPQIGKPIIGALDTLKHLNREGHHLILWTMRDGKQLEDAVNYLRDNGVVLLSANKNPQQSAWTTSPKVYAHLYIDDAALGCPTFQSTDHTRPQVDWLAVNRRLYSMEIINFPDLDPLRHDEFFRATPLDRETYFREVYPPQVI